MSREEIRDELCRLLGRLRNFEQDFELLVNGAYTTGFLDAQNGIEEEKCNGCVHAVVSHWGGGDKPSYFKCNNCGLKWGNIKYLPELTKIQYMEYFLTPKEYLEESKKQ